MENWVWRLGTLAVYAAAMLGVYLGISWFINGLSDMGATVAFFVVMGALGLGWVWFLLTRRR